MNLREFPLAVHDAIGGEFFEGGEGGVFAHGEAAGEAFGVTVRRHERGFVQKLMSVQCAPLQRNAAMRNAKARQRFHQLRLAVSGNTGDTDDFALRHIEGDILEAFTAEGGGGEADVLRCRLQFLWEGGAQVAADDEAQEIGVADGADQ